MKRANKALTPALFAIGAVAQSGSSPILGSSTIITNPSDTGVVYETYSICPSNEVTTITGPTSTYCPGPYCSGGPTNAPGAGSSTVYVTELVNVCPTATNEAGWLTTVTTTISEACPCSEGMHTSGYVPNGYTTALATCTVCGENSPVATIITPVATAGAYVQATAAAGANAGSGSGSGSSDSGSGSNAGASAGAGANVGSGSGSPGSGSGSGAPGSGSGSGAPGSGSGSGSGSGPDSNAQASAAAGAGASAGTGSNSNSGSSSPASGGAASPGSSDAADYAPGSGAGGAGSSNNNSTFTPPMSPSAGSGVGGGSASGISPPIAMQSHSAAPAGRSGGGIDVAGTLLLGIAGLVGTLAWQL